MGFDMRLVFDTPEDFLNILKMRYIVFCPKTTLKVYGVPVPSLKEFRAQGKQKAYSFEAAPDEKYRLKQEEIPGQGDPEESKKDKRQTEQS